MTQSNIRLFGTSSQVLTVDLQDNKEDHSSEDNEGLSSKDDNESEDSEDGEGEEEEDITLDGKEHRVFQPSRNNSKTSLGHHERTHTD